MTEVALDAALAQIDSWPVDTAAAAVIGVDGVRAHRGAVDHAFALASVTKPLLVLAALVAVEEGAIELSDAPADPQLAEVVPQATLRHLMSHASGLATDRAVRAAATGTRRIYSNIGIDTVAASMVSATGIDHESYFAEALGAPLGLTSTRLGARPSRDGTSTVTDLARVVAEVLAPTGVLSRSTLTEAATVQLPGLRGVLPGYGVQDANDWGLGFEIRGTKHPHWTGRTNSPATIGHFGQAGTMLWIDPVAEIGLVALADRGFDTWAVQAWPVLSDAVLAAV